MGAVCCRELVLTRFCPHCGKEVSVHQLAGLYAHVNACLEHHRKILVKWEKLFDENKDNYDSDRRAILERRNKRKALLVAKWVGWSDALCAVMERDSTP